MVEHTVVTQVTFPQELAVNGREKGYSGSEA